MEQNQKMKTPKQVIQLLKQRREELQITQTELAQYCNLSRSGISKIEQGAKDIRLSTLLKMTKILGLQMTIRWDER